MGDFLMGDFCNDTSSAASYAPGITMTCNAESVETEEGRAAATAVAKTDARLQRLSQKPTGGAICREPCRCFDGEIESRVVGTLSGLLEILSSSRGGPRKTRP